MKLIYKRPVYVVNLGKDNVRSGETYAIGDFPKVDLVAGCTHEIV